MAEARFSPAVGEWYWCRESTTTDIVRVMRCAALRDGGIVAALAPGSGLNMSIDRVVAEVAECDLPDEARQASVVRRSMLDLIFGLSRMMRADKERRQRAS